MPGSDNEKSFAKEIIGTIDLNPGSKIVFSMSDYNGKRYGSIRKIVNTNDYDGPKKGPYLTEEAVHKVLFELKKLLNDKYPLTKDEDVLCKIQIYGGRTIILKRDFFENEYSFQLREHWDTAEFTKFGERGVRIPIKYIDQTIDLFEKMLERF